MDSGIMQQIRTLLSQGHASGEVIAKGFAPPTVYKVQRRMRQARPAGQRPAGPATSGAVRLHQENRRVAESEGDEGHSNRDQLQAELDSLQEQYEELSQYVSHLEGHGKELLSLRARIASLEPEAQDAPRLRERVNELERQLQHASHGQVEMSQAAMQWRAKFEAEGASRRHAEQELQKQCLDERTRRVKAEQQWGLWRDNAQKLAEQNKALFAAVAELEPLRVWAGHPCKVCKRPLPSVVSREDAARLTQDFAHTECLKKDSGSGAAIAVGLIGLYALSQIRKGP